MKNHILTTAFTLLVFFVPQFSDAYFTTAQHGFTVDNKTAVYTIDFSFGHPKHEVLIPIVAQSSSEKAEHALLYEVQNNDGKPVFGTVTGIVLSTAKVQNGMYVSPKGKAESYTLLVFYTPNETGNESSAHLQVTHLPFSFDGTQQLQLNPSELQYYKSPAVSLHTPLFVFPGSASFTIHK